MGICAVEKFELLKEKFCRINPVRGFAAEIRNQLNGSFPNFQIAKFPNCTFRLNPPLAHQQISILF